MAQDPADDIDAGVADTEMDADYVTNITLAQGAWDPWPTHD